MDQSPMGGGLPYTHQEPTADEVKLTQKLKAARKAKPAVKVEAKFSIGWPPGCVAPGKK